MKAVNTCHARSLSRRIAAVVWLLVMLTASPLVSAAPKDIADRVQACAGCHGEAGRVPASEDYFPSIAGKPAGYLYEQLINFRHGRRHHEIMHAMFAVLSDSYLYEIAEYYAAQTPRVAPPSRASSDATTGAEGLIRKGDPERDLPACTACHGERLLGASPTIPGLLGLRSEYLAAQLGAWREGTRRAAAPDCMHTIAQRLTSDEIDRVSRWLASQAYPAGEKPRQGLPEPLPLPCGASR